MEDYISSIIQVVPGPDFTAYAYFTDGAMRLADMKLLIEKGGVFERIADESIFSEPLTVANGRWPGTMASWTTKQDSILRELGHLSVDAVRFEKAVSGFRHERDKMRQRNQPFSPQVRAKEAAQARLISCGTVTVVA